ncbi:MAG TPA: DUF4040 domain-containing protein [Candidatus Aenigmarchaeota archaeon]|nr:MAG: hypothetical protein DRP03_00670 [Candidatus Aenigmarchaeota archaeon]HDD46409.1 DUF4040 domain-containing protein [Candidatus Aenigmarchaeota archaeon]
MFEIIEMIILLGVICTSVAAMLSKDLLVSVVLLAAMSLLLSLEFYILHAPDVAIAEAAIGAGLSTAIYIMAINKTDRWENENG